MKEKKPPGLLFALCNKVTLKSAPIPVSRNTQGNVLMVTELALYCRRGCWAVWCRLRTSAGGRVFTRGLAVCSTTPHFEFREAVRACPARGASWVVVRVLVKGDVESRVRITEDVATFSAVVSTCPVVEVAHTRGFVTDGRFRIGLPVKSCGHCRRFGKHIHIPIPITINPFSAVPGGAAA